MGAVGVLIEREVELAALGELIAAALAGRGGAALVGGEAGIGKTRLLTRARQEASRAGVRVLYATADEIEANVPLAVARVLLARAAREIDADAARDQPAAGTQRHRPADRRPAGRPPRRRGHAAAHGRRARGGAAVARPQPHEAVSGGSAATPCSRNTASSSSMRRASAG